MLRPASTPTPEKQYRELADNLIESLGPQRAAHVARQYCWREVAQEIASHDLARADTLERNKKKHRSQRD